MEYINLTPHDIILNDGRVFKASGMMARVEDHFGVIDGDICTVTYGDVYIVRDGERLDMPEQVEGTTYIVSAMTLFTIRGRTDFVAPATGHKDTVRNERGHIVSVPCFVR